MNANKFKIKLVDSNPNIIDSDPNLIILNKKALNLNNEIQISSFNQSVRRTNLNMNHISFKNPAFSTKYKHIKQQGKALKNYMIDPNDLISYNLYTSLEVGPSVEGKLKFCDITGFKGNYYDKTSQLRFFNSDIYKIVSEIPEPIKNQYLSIRKALFVLK